MGNPARKTSHHPNQLFGCHNIPVWVKDFASFQHHAAEHDLAGQIRGREQLGALNDKIKRVCRPGFQAGAVRIPVAENFHFVDRPITSP